MNGEPKDRASDGMAAGDKLAAIPTRAFGYQFRSRLEAKWAHLFTALGWRWEYEPLDLDGWIPDFLLHTKSPPTLVEIKPESTIEGLHRHVAKVEQALIGAPTDYEVLLLGCTPLPAGDRSAGLLGRDPWRFTGKRRNYEACEWATCTECGRIAFFDMIGIWLCRLCGAGGKVYVGANPEEAVRRLWANACNATQWRAR
jgi:hypothetical protein